MREPLGLLVRRLGNWLLGVGDRIAGYEVVSVIPFFDLEPEHALEALRKAEIARVAPAEETADA